VISRANGPGARRVNTCTYPWAALEHVPRAEADTLRAVRQWLGMHVRLEKAGALLDGRIGTPSRIRVRKMEPAAIAPELDDVARVVVVPPGSESADGLLLELEGALANAIVARALRRPPSFAVHAGSVPEPVRGAVAAILAGVLRRACVGTALEVRSPSRSAPFPLEDALSVSLTVVVGDEAYLAKAVFSKRRLPFASVAGTWEREALVGLGATPIQLPVVASRIELTVAEAASLGPGDVVLPGSWPLSRTSSGLSGRVALAAPGSDVGVRADLVDGSRIVLRGEHEPLGPTEGAMRDEGGGALIEAIGDVPVVVRVELGEATMSAREWASLSPGDVVGLGRRVGEHVLLRIGGVPVARGELVDLEGEVGVRIVARLAEETTAG
jgi:type III secretion system YscQ/HrcQ family protein